MLRPALALAFLVPSAFAAELELAPTQGGPVIAPVRLDAPLSIPTLGALSDLRIIEGVSLSPISLAAPALANASISAQAAEATAASAAPLEYASKRINAKGAQTAANASAVAAERTALFAAQSAMSAERSEIPVEARLDALFDRSPVRKETDAAVPTLVDRSSPRKRSFLKRFAPAATTAALFLATPAVAFAQGADGPGITAAHSLSLLSGIHPLASAAGALIGAVIGLLVSRPKDGSEPSAGDVLANVLRYGVIGGAGVYALLDITRLAFVGPTVGLVPLAAAVATAALGRTAFPKKFADQATTSADRVVGAFPAVAAAMGLTVGVSLVPIAAPIQLAAFAMSVTGLATAVYSAVFKPGRSPVEGPDNFGKGYVLQALFSGLALALSGWLVYPFAALAAGGFLLVLWTAGKELWSLVPKKP